MKIGFVVNDTAFSEIHYKIIKEANKLVSEHEACIFTNHISPRVIDINCAVFNICNASDFYNGLLIACKLDEAKTLSKIKNNSKKVFFIWDLEWIYSNYMYNDVVDTLLSPNLFIVSRTEKYDQLLFNLCGRKADLILEDLDLEKIWNSLVDTKNT